MDLTKYTELELRALKTRAPLVTEILIAEQISRRAAVLVEVSPEIAAKILEVISEATVSPTIVIPHEKSQAATNGEDSKIIDGKVVRPASETALAIDDFLRREGHREPA